MDSKSLMIGDWVKHLNNPSRIKGAVDLTFAKDFEPIPLTAEILEKNGIVKVGRPYEYEDDDWIQRYKYGYDFDMLHSTKDGFLWKGVSLEYVHILQHALRLCGLTDLADNFKV